MPGVPVILRMNRAVITAVEIDVVLLFPVVGKRLARDLAPGDASAIGEGGEKDRIDSGPFLENVEDAIRALVNE